MTNLNEYSDEAILTTKEVAQWLGCSEHSVRRMPLRRTGIPSLSATFLAKDVKDVVMGQERKRAVPRPRASRRSARS